MTGKPLGGQHAFVGTRCRHKCCAPRPRRGLGRLAVAYGALLAVSSFLGIGAGLLVMMDPFAGETFDPSQGALTALGISEPVSFAATGVTVFLLPVIAVLVMFRRSHDGPSQGGLRDDLHV